MHTEYQSSKPNLFSLFFLLRQLPWLPQWWLHPSTSSSLDANKTKEARIKQVSKIYHSRSTKACKSTILTIVSHELTANRNHVRQSQMAIGLLNRHLLQKVVFQKYSLMMFTKKYKQFYYVPTQEKPQMRRTA